MSQKLGSVPLSSDADAKTVHQRHNVLQCSLPVVPCGTWPHPQNGLAFLAAEGPMSFSGHSWVSLSLLTSACSALPHVHILSELLKCLVSRVLPTFCLKPFLYLTFISLLLLSYIPLAPKGTTPPRVQKPQTESQSMSLRASWSSFKLLLLQCW